MVFRHLPFVVMLKSYRIFSSLVEQLLYFCGSSNKTLKQECDFLSTFIIESFKGGVMGINLLIPLIIPRFAPGALVYLTSFARETHVNLKYFS